MFCLRINESVVSLIKNPGLINNYLWNDLLLKDHIDEAKPYLIVRETGKDGENPHFHVAGELQDGKTLQNFRTFLNREGIKGNEAYSLKKGNPEKMDRHFTYLCKGTDAETPSEVICRHPDFTDEVIAQRHQIYWQVNAQLPKKKRKTESVTAAADQIALLCKQRIAHNKAESLSEDEIIDIAVAWQHANRKTLNDFFLKSVINHVTYTLKGMNCNRMEQFRNKLKYNNF
ncbi:MAG: hypothetical protein [Circular genetic element sp.]|nr:MAG: hypothetical protein [Circular genetic element sp.]